MKSGPDNLFINNGDMEANRPLQWDSVRQWGSDIEYVRADIAESSLELSIEIGREKARLAIIEVEELLSKMENHFGAVGGAVLDELKERLLD